MTISSSSMLVDLSISVWTANKVDKTATTKVAIDNNAGYDAGLYRKNLMAGTTMRKVIADYAAGCRTWHNTRTLPWTDRGTRLLPTSLFLDYKHEANARRDYFNDKVAEFLREYPNLVRTASFHLGTMFNPDEYPSVDEVASKFAFSMVFSPVPEAGDFRLDVGNADMEMLKQQYEEASNARINEAMRTSWDRLHDMVESMSGKLVEPEGDVEVKRRWHETFITNAQEMCSMLTHLNVTKDPKLEQARRDLEKAIANVDIEDVKEDPTVRTDMKAKLDEMLRGYDW